MNIIFASTIWMTVGMSFLFLFIGIILGWCIALKVFKKQLKDNPPINEQQIRDLYKQLGRKPSEKQVQQIMTNFKK